MKKKLILFLMCLMFLITGCQRAARSWGGTMTLKLEPGQKLEVITWKDDDSLWYLTRPMRENEYAETYTFHQSSEWGVFEGTVEIIEFNKE